MIAPFIFSDSRPPVASALALSIGNDVRIAIHLAEMIMSYTS